MVDDPSRTREEQAHASRTPKRACHCDPARTPCIDWRFSLCLPDEAGQRERLSGVDLQGRPRRAARPVYGHRRVQPVAFSREYRMEGEGRWRGVRADEITRDVCQIRRSWYFERPINITACGLRLRP